MTTRKTTAEQIADAQSKIEQYENRMKLLLQKQKAQDRKDRTRRLIERGAILESLIDGADAASNEQVKAFLEKTIKTEFARRIWQEIVPPSPKTSETQQPQSGESAAPEPTTPPPSGGTGTEQNPPNGARTTG
jgi:multidrug resistance efflux pump